MNIASCLQAYLDKRDELERDIERYQEARRDYAQGLMRGCQDEIEATRVHETMEELEKLRMRFLACEGRDY